jgi:negative regulator of sigma E activity
VAALHGTEGTAGEVAMDDGKDGLTDIDRAIAQALDVEPSADFQALVRQRVAGERMRIPFWRRRLLWIPAVAAAAIVVLAVLKPPARPVTSGGGITAPTRSVARVETPDLKVGPTNLSQVGRDTGFRRPDLHLGRDQAGPAATARRANQPEVLVPPEEIEMYRRLIARALAVPGAVVVEAPADVAPKATFEDLTIDPIPIDPIAPPEGGEGVRQ